MVCVRDEVNNICSCTLSATGRTCEDIVKSKKHCVHTYLLAYSRRGNRSKWTIWNYRKWQRFVVICEFSRTVQFDVQREKMIDCCICSSDDHMKASIASIAEWCAQYALFGDWRWSSHCTLVRERLQTFCHAMPMADGHGTYVFISSYKNKSKNWTTTEKMHS